MDHLTKIKLLCDSQHGFSGFRSCVIQLLQLVHQWLSTLDTFGAVDIAFLDFAKAFDKVSHSHLLQRLQSYVINSEMCDWLRHFLVGRVQRVVIEGKTSSWLNFTSAVPRESILGPLLFLIFINDIPSRVNCNIDLFWDDRNPIFVNFRQNLLPRLQTIGYCA